MNNTTTTFDVPSRQYPLLQFPNKCICCGQLPSTYLVLRWGLGNNRGLRIPYCKTHAKTSKMIVNLLRGIGLVTALIALAIAFSVYNSSTYQSSKEGAGRLMAVCITPLFLGILVMWLTSIIISKFVHSKIDLGDILTLNKDVAVLGISSKLKVSGTLDQAIMSVSFSNPDIAREVAALNGYRLSP